MPTSLYIVRAMSRNNQIRLSPKDIAVLRLIRNAIVHTGKSPSIRELQATMGYKSPRSITVILKRLMDKEILQRKDRRGLTILNEPEAHTFNASTIDVPIVGSAACGIPLLAEEYIEAKIPVSITLAKPPHRYFLLHANGDSMNRAGIENGDLVLVRQQESANNGNIVVALIDSEVTIKRFKQLKNAIILEPSSTNPKHVPIILQRDFFIQGVVVATFSSEKQIES